MKKGFTLIELLAVIVILGIVVAVAIPGINIIITNSRKKSVIIEAKLLHSAAIRKLGEYPDFDFSIINKNNLKEHLEVDGSVYDEVSVYNNNGKIKILLKRYGIRVNTDGNSANTSLLPPYIAYEFDFSLGDAFVNIYDSDLNSQSIYL